MTAKTKSDDERESASAGTDEANRPDQPSEDGLSLAERANQNARAQIDEMNARTEEDREAERGAATVNTDAPATRNRA